ncbi:MAG: tRNA adenosine(34) deaminase TadA [Phycisphaerales bacterium JB052]
MMRQPEPPQPSETDIAMMQRAIELAQQSADAGEVPVGAIVYDTQTGAIIAQAHNTREMHNNPAGHAEFSAIRNACKAIDDWRLNHCTLVVTLEPCPMCAGLIVNARVGRLVYGASDPKAGAVRSLFALCDDTRLNHRCEIHAGVLQDECALQLSSFFQDLRAQRKASRDG